MQSDKPDPLIGATLGSYRIVEHIGDGGMGSVYRAVDDMLERDVALKFLRPVLVGHPEIAERFRIEAVALARLQHAHIATLYGLVRSDDRMFMVMEFVKGETVQALVEREGRLSVDLALTICDEALQALEYAHRAGIVHRDIKPGNLMLTTDGQVKLMDFGVARVLGTERYTRTGLAVGTVTYMSPEQINGPGVDVDGRSDIYSLGIVLYQLVTGRVPFTAESEYALMHAHLNTPPPALSAVADVPPAVEAVVLRALEKQPAHRFQTPAEFRAAIADARTHIAGATRKSGPRRSPRPDGGKRRKLTDPGAPTVGVRAIRPKTSPSKTTPSVPAASAEPPLAEETRPGAPAIPDTARVSAVVAPPTPAPTGAGAPATTAPSTAAPGTDAAVSVESPSVITPVPTGVMPLPRKTSATGPTAPTARPAWMKPAIAAAAILVVAAVIGWVFLLNAGRVDRLELAEAPAPPAAPIENGVLLPAPPTERELTVAPVVPAAPAEPVPNATPVPSQAAPSQAAPSQVEPAPVSLAEAAAVASAPTAPTGPAAPTRSFDDVQLAFRQGNDNRERDVRLTFGPTSIVVADRRSGQTLNELPYSAISGATYVQAREPRWQDAGARADLAPWRGGAFSFLTSSPHWLTLQTATEGVALLVEGGIRRQVMTELTSRGVKIEEPR